MDIKKLILSIASITIASAAQAQISIDNGRQLFVDDLVVESTDLQRTWHHPEKFEGNPVMKPETAWEKPEGGNAAACTKGGGIWWDESEKVFKLWYDAGWHHTICYAVSKDGINWERPDLDVVPGTNIVVRMDDPAFRPDSWSVVKDPDAKNPDELYKMMIHRPWTEPWGGPDGACLVSPDGIHWKEVAPLPASGDRSTMYYNPFKERWVFSLRSNWTDNYLSGGPRNRMYYELEDFMEGPCWETRYRGSVLGHTALEQNLEKWIDRDDTLDPVDPDVPGLSKTQLYNFDAVAYESIMVGMLEIHIGPENGECEPEGLPKITDLKFAYSRDGKNFSRPEGGVAIGSERWASDAWDRGYVQPVSNLFVVNGDELWFYYGAFKGDPERGSRHGNHDRVSENMAMYDNSCLGIARMRRDGFASLDGSGTLTTKPLRFSGRHLFVNVSAPEGAIAAEIIDDEGNVVEGYSAKDSRVRKVDSTKLLIRWKKKDGITLSKFVPYRIRFILENASLYSFWVAMGPDGASNGYLAGGGPGYDGLKDIPDQSRPETAPNIMAPDSSHSKENRRMEGIPSIAVTADGAMWATWYGGPTLNEDEYNYLILARSENGRDWKEIMVCDPDFEGPRRNFDPEIFVSPDGLLRWTWTDRVGAVFSLNGGDQLWMATIDPETSTLTEEPRVIARGVMMNKPCFLKDGTWLLPVAHWWENPSSCVYASTDGGRTFEYRGGATVPVSDRVYDEHTIIEKKDGSLKVYIRTASSGNCLWEADSQDGGRTWSKACPSRAASLSSRTFVTRLGDGKWLMVKHGAYSKYPDNRRDLTALISDDDGKTWWGGLVLDPRVGCSYPDGQQLENGKIVIVSDFDRVGSREISYVEISEEDILRGSVNPKDSDIVPERIRPAREVHLPERIVISEAGR
ncbi:MAG: exo-alpha-sialidase [Bacteroidales bacterium]|nr:exo-alpha-sialidase [Bacteroidales bacterium]